LKRLAVIAVVGLVGALVPASSAAPAGVATATLKASPNTKLVDGQDIKITWSNFPGSGVFVRQCVGPAPPPPTGACSNYLGDVRISGSSGSATFTIRVEDGYCDPDHACVLTAYSGFSNAKRVAFTSLTFAAGVQIERDRVTANQVVGVFTTGFKPGETIIVSYRTGLSSHPSSPIAACTEKPFDDCSGVITELYTGAKGTHTIMAVGQSSRRTAMTTVTVVAV
jgi:hypothetical protein